VASPNVEAIDLGDRRVYLFAGGSMANQVAGHGDSLNAFDVTLAVMTSGIGHMVGAGAEEPVGGAHPVDADPSATFKKICVQPRPTQQ
jgi:hypothetical protein